MIPDQTLETTLVTFTPKARYTPIQTQATDQRPTLFAGSILTTCVLAGFGVINPAVAVLVATGAAIAFNPHAEAPLSKDELKVKALVKSQKDLEMIGFRHTRTLITESKVVIVTEYTETITPEMDALFIRVQKVIDDFIKISPKSEVYTAFFEKQIGICLTD
jgi:hypothetical protein